MFDLLNKVSRSSESDECWTPFYAVEPLLKYLPKDKTIWCPFDTERSAYVQLLKENGYSVVFSHIERGQDFFTYEPDNWDILVSNPPFSKKDKVLKRCYELNKPFALLLPDKAILGQTRFKLYKNRLQLLLLDKRVGFFTRNDFVKVKEGNHFGSLYFCYKLLPRDIEYVELNKEERSLI